MSELVSVIMSAYNEKESYLREAIESIINQTYKNIEFIIVLDNPDNKEIYDILKEYEKKDNRIKLIINEANLGLPASLNKGIKIAKGNYIARMDADDKSFPGRIDRQLNFLIDNKLDMVAAKRIDIDENDEIIEKKDLPKMKPEEVNMLLPITCFITHPSVLIRKSVLEKLGGYRNINSAEDYDLWLRMLEAKCRIGLIDEYLIYYRIRKESISRSDYYKQILTARYLKKAYRKHQLESNNINQDIEKYLKSNKYYNSTFRDRFNKSYTIFLNGLESIKKKQIFRGIFEVFGAIYLNKKCIVCILDLIKYKCMLKFRLKKYSDK